MFFVGAGGAWIPHFMAPENYLGQTSSTTVCYIGIMEEKTGKTDFWLLGDNFLRGYY